jgi:hypothetical protein
MGFDKNDAQPLIRPRRWGTKVNLAMVVGVLIFFALGVIGILWVRSHPKQAVPAAGRPLSDRA